MNSKKNGRGSYMFKSGTIFDGEFKDDKFSGNGILKYKNGDIYDG